VTRTTADIDATLPSVAHKHGVATFVSSLRDHWPEYAIEGWALGMFMLSAALFSTLFDYPGSPLHRAIADADLRRMLVGIAMGLTAIGLIYSPWGKRSGAHMNPAVTLTFWRLGKVRGWDALFYSLAQFVGGTLGVLLASAILGPAFADPPVSYAATVPGAGGVPVALVAEFGISALMMLTILTVSNDARLAKFTGIIAGTLVATYITFEAPLSGMSMNPARTFASAFPGGIWTSFWLYLVAPVAGMQFGALLHAARTGPGGNACAKLIHSQDQRCIHCGFEPSRLVGEVQ
jgi:aquaporin Z